jgi:hypothetical protein
VSFASHYVSCVALCPASCTLATSQHSHKFPHEEHIEDVQPSIECVTDVIQPPAACHSLGWHSSRLPSVCEVPGPSSSSRALPLLRAMTLSKIRLRGRRTVRHWPTSRRKLLNSERRPRQYADMVIVHQPQQFAGMVVVSQLIRQVPHLSRQRPLQHAQWRP